MKRNIVIAVLLALSLIGTVVGQTQPAPQEKPGNSVPNVIGGRIGPDIAGEWTGTLEAGGRKLRLALKIARAADLKLSATLDSPDQNVTGMPANKVELDRPDLTVSFDDLGAEFFGELNGAETELTGPWEQGGKSFPLTLRRTQADEKTKKPEHLPASLAGFEDDATFNVVVNEERLGTMKSVWKPDGSVDTQVTITVAGQTVNSTSRITPGPDGRWIRIVMESPAATVTIVREGSSVTRTIKDKSTTWETREGVLLFDNNAPILISHALRAYDRAKGGAQKFPLLVLPGAALDLTLEAGEKVERSAGGRDLSLTKFIFSVRGVDLQVFADAGNKVYLVEIPSQKAAFVREGYSALRRLEAADPLLSAPKYEVEIDRAVGVPMRDGVRLATDIYRPKGLEKAPLILVRTPYKKDMGELQARFYARRGYVFAVQDCR